MVSAISYGPGVPDDGDLRLCGDVNGKRVIELGGTANAIAFAERGARAMAAATAEQVEEGREQAEQAGVRVEFHAGDVADLGFATSASVELVFSTALAGVDDLARVLRQAHRVLRPETSLVFAVPHPMAAMLEGGEIVLRRGYGSGTRTTSDYFMAVHAGELPRRRDGRAPPRRPAGRAGPGRAGHAGQEARGLGRVPSGRPNGVWRGSVPHPRRSRARPVGDGRGSSRPDARPGSGRCAQAGGSARCCSAHHASRRRPASSSPSGPSSRRSSSRNVRAWPTTGPGRHAEVLHHLVAVELGPDRPSAPPRPASSAMRASSSSMRRARSGGLALVARRAVAAGQHDQLVSRSPASRT